MGKKFNLNVNFSAEYICLMIISDMCDGKNAQTFVLEDLQVYEFFSINYAIENFYPH